MTGCVWYAYVVYGDMVMNSYLFIFQQDFSPISFIGYNKKYN